MKYRNFIINSIFSDEFKYYSGFFGAIGNMINPEITMVKMEYDSDYKILYIKLMEELIGNTRAIKATHIYGVDEIDKYELLLMTASGQRLGFTSWTIGSDGVVWTISLGGKFKSFPVSNWDAILKFIKDNI